jgi:malate:Na+ symporter
MENSAQERLDRSPLAAPDRQTTTGFWPRWWSRLLTAYIGIIPPPIYLVLLIVIAGFALTGKVPGEISMVVAIMALGGFTLGEIGKRLPILRDVGAAAMLILIVPSYLVFQHLLPAPLLNVTLNFFNTTNILSLFIAIVVVGSILSMERHTLIAGFLKVFLPLIAGSIMAAIVGLLVGMVLGLGAYHTFFFIIVPIMGGGLAEGALPLTIGYAQILHQAQGNLFAQVVPAVLIGNFTATLLTGLLNYLGKKTPHLTGEGNLEPGEQDSPELTQDERSGQIDMRHIAAVGITAITLYLLGSLCTRLFGIPGLIVLIVLAIIIKLAHMVAPEQQQGATQLYKFFVTVFTFPMLFAVSIALIQWKQLVAGFAFPNLITALAVVATLMGTGFVVGRWIRLYPIETAIVNLCHSGMGGAGDLAILTAANRMKLMPFAQIATRIGGIAMVALALLLLAHFV